MAKILLCDDSKIILSLLEKKLTEIGHHVVGKARDGEECLKLYPQTHPDLVLLDVTMPNKDGRQCLVELMQLDASAKVIMLSALANEDVRIDCLKNGARAFVSKAHLNSPDDFQSKILAVINPFLQVA